MNREFERKTSKLSKSEVLPKLYGALAGLLMVSMLFLKML